MRRMHVVRLMSLSGCSGLRSGMRRSEPSIRQPQQLDCLLKQRYAVLLRRLHAVGRMDSQLRIEVDLGPASSHTSPDLVAVGTACSNAPGAESLHAARVNHELARLVATAEQSGASPS